MPLAGLSCVLSIAAAPALSRAEPPAASTESAPVDGAPAEDPLFGDDFDTELDATPSGFPDPLEPMNRQTLAFNRALDRWLLDPITRLYGAILPDGIKASVRLAFLNMASVPTLANQLLQCEGKEAGITTARLLINTTIGIAGLLDPATGFGLEAQHADFGQTLAKLGFGSGPYLVVPVLGPANVRDGIGGLVDILIHPTTFIFGPFQRLTYGSGSGLSQREAHYQALKALDESSIDYYAALRNGYYQARIADIWEGEPPPPPRRRICESMKARISRQPWRRPRYCSEASLSRLSASLAAWP
jgi:phospholipid-binding lipoprotein MlaA